ncbi:MAG TPA: hypothetical protein DIT89_05840 [Planctomycetaceae bacterium]|nr:hypothetical protein [Planctomycetaceae bacterium]
MGNCFLFLCACVFLFSVIGNALHTLVLVSISQLFFKKILKYLGFRWLVLGVFPEDLSQSSGSACVVCFA